MKYTLKILVLTSLILTEVYSIVPKYIPSAATLSKQRSLDDTRFPKSRLFQPLETPESGIYNEKYKVDALINDVPKNPQTLTIDLLIEDDKRKNRLPEVNLKDLINSAEVVNDQSVEDFVDLSFEDNASAETKDQISKKYPPESQKTVNLNNSEKYSTLEEEMVSKDVDLIDNKRFKRVAAASYDGRYKSQDINDVLKSIAVSKIQKLPNKLDRNITKNKNDLAMSRRERSSKVIEEENLVTAISVLKFTGRLTLLNEDLAFKNIHT